MFLGKHDIYHSVILYYMKIRTLAPKEVQKYIEQNETFKDLETIVVERVVTTSRKQKTNI